MSKTNETLTFDQIDIIAARQRYKCANEPGSNIKYLEKFLCPQWKDIDEFKGNFDEGGFEIDHITEFCIGQNDHADNLQALCTTCHSVKHKKFMMYCNKEGKNNVITNNNNNTYNIYINIYVNKAYKWKKCKNQFDSDNNSDDKSNNDYYNESDDDIDSAYEQNKNINLNISI